MPQQRSMVEVQPPGMVAHFANFTAPEGWLICNGQAVSRTLYSDLFAAIGVVYGSGDGNTTFNLPDLRGEFIRGLDSGRGVDSGRAVGTSQGDAMRNVTGEYGANWMTRDVATVFRATGPFYDAGAGGLAHGASGYSNSRIIGFDASRQVPTATEFRPRNVALLACIKY